MKSTSNKNNVYHGYPFEEDQEDTGSTRTPDKAAAKPLQQIAGPKKPSSRTGVDSPKKRTF